MARGKAEDAGGLTPAKDDNAVSYHFAPRTLPIFKCADYIPRYHIFPRLRSPIFVWSTLKIFGKNTQLYSAYCTNFPKIERLRFSFL